MDSKEFVSRNKRQDIAADAALQRLFNDSFLLLNSNRVATYPGRIDAVPNGHLNLSPFESRKDDLEEMPRTIDSDPREVWQVVARMIRRVDRATNGKPVPITGDTNCNDLDFRKLPPGAWIPITGDTPEDREKLVLKCKADQARRSNQIDENPAVDDETAQEMIASGQVSACQPGYRLPVCFITGD